LFLWLGGGSGRRALAPVPDLLEEQPEDEPDPPHQARAQPEEAETEGRDQKRPEDPIGARNPAAAAKRR